MGRVRCEAARQGSRQRSRFRGPLPYRAVAAWRRQNSPAQPLSSGGGLPGSRALLRGSAARRLWSWNDGGAAAGLAIAIAGKGIRSSYLRVRSVDSKSALSLPYMSTPPTRIPHVQIVTVHCPKYRNVAYYSKGSNLIEFAATHAVVNLIPVVIANWHY